MCIIEGRGDPRDRPRCAALSALITAWANTRFAPTHCAALIVGCPISLLIWVAPQHAGQAADRAGGLAQLVHLHDPAGHALALIERLADRGICRHQDLAWAERDEVQREAVA